jgi:acyl-CoA thioesterase
MSHLSAQEIAERSARAMWSGDRASQWLGMTLDAVAPGTATTSMIVEDHHLNGHKICHGGYIFTLADSAFAFACNSYNQLAVAQHNSISYLAPGMGGERLVATAIEVSRTGRSGIYDVTVTGEGGRTVALFRGTSRTIKGTHFDDQEILP